MQVYFLDICTSAKNPNRRTHTLLASEDAPRRPDHLRFLNVLHLEIDFLNLVHCIIIWFIKEHVCAATKYLRRVVCGVLVCVRRCFVARPRRAPHRRSQRPFILKIYGYSSVPSVSFDSVHTTIYIWPWKKVELLPSLAMTMPFLKVLPNGPCAQ